MLPPEDVFQCGRIVVLVLQLLGDYLKLSASPRLIFCTGSKSKPQAVLDVMWASWETDRMEKGKGWLTRVAAALLPVLACSAESEDLSGLWLQDLGNLRMADQRVQK